MKIVIADGLKSEQFVTIFKNIQNKINTVNLIFRETGLYVQGMDPSQIGLFELLLVKSWFEDYDITTTNTLGISCELFSKMLNCLEKSHHIEMIFAEAGDTMEVKLLSQEKGEVKKCFTLPLMDIDSEIMGIPSTEYTADLQIRSILFEKIIEQLLVFAETVSIRCTEENISLKTTKESALLEGEMEVNINFEDMTEYIIEEEADLTLRFSLKYMKWIVQFAKLSQDTHIHFKLDIPMKLTYKLGEGSFIQFYLAPQFDEF